MESASILIFGKRQFFAAYFHSIKIIDENGSSIFSQEIDLLYSQPEALRGGEQHG